MVGNYFRSEKLKPWAVFWLLISLVSASTSQAGVRPGTLVAAVTKPVLAGAARASEPLHAALPKTTGPARAAALASAGPSGNKTKNNGQVLVVVRGNSQANGYLTTGGASAIGSETNGVWVDQAAALLGSGYVWQNRSKNGATIDYLRLSDATEVAPLFHTGNYGEEWIVLQETVNQIFQANPAQQVYGKMAAWAQYWHSQGVKVAVVTCYPMHDGQYDPEIDAINDLYRANWSSFCDMLLDAKSSPYLTQLGMDPKYGYSPDGLHLTDTGNQLVAHCAADGFRGSRSGIIPAPFMLPGIAVPGGATTAPTPPTPPTVPTAPTPAPPAAPTGTSLRLRYGAGPNDYVTDGNGVISQRLDQSGQGRIATVTPGLAGPVRANDNGQQVAVFNATGQGPVQSLTTVGALAANSDASFVVDLRVLHGGANSVLSVGPDFSIWFQNSSKLQVFDKGGNYVSPVELSNQGLTRCIFTFEASTRQMVLYVADAEVYRATLTALPWVGDTPVLDLEQGSYWGGRNALSGELGTLAVYSGLLSPADRSTWFSGAPAASAASTPPATPAPTPAPTSTTNLRLRYGTGTGDYVTNNKGGILQRLDQSGQGRIATVTPGQDGPLSGQDNGQQIALFDPGRKGWTQSLTTVGALAANSDASFVVDLRVLHGGANSVLSVGPDFSIWFQNSSKLQVFDKGGNYVSPVELSNQGLTRCIFTFEASTRQMVLYVADAEVYRATLTALPWVGDTPVLDLEQGSYWGGRNALSGELGTLAVYSGLLSPADRTAWFSGAPAASSATLSAFTASASASGTAVSLSWSAAAPKSNTQYQVERSADGVLFSRVGAVAATGTSATAKSYALTDHALPAAGTLYYRVRKVDASGVASYSPVRTVAMDPAGTSLVLYPNPAHAATRLQNAEPNAKVQVLDSMGRVVATATTDATGAVELALPPSLAKGVYIVRQGARFSRLVVE